MIIDKIKSDSDLMNEMVDIYNNITSKFLELVKKGELTDSEIESLRDKNVITILTKLNELITTKLNYKCVGDDMDKVWDLVWNEVMKRNE
ncbi:MAG: hypothetical protein ACON4A_06080 [Flavobacteriaceae bacterium]